MLPDTPFGDDGMWHNRGRSHIVTHTIPERKLSGQIILLGGWPTPLKNDGVSEFVSWDDVLFPTEWENKTCFKPPTRIIHKLGYLDVIRWL